MSWYIDIFHYQGV